MTVLSLINEVQSRGIELWAEAGQLKLKAPKGALTDTIREQLIANKADIVSFLHDVSSRTKVPPILPIARSEVDRLPLSFAQERLWFIHQLDPGSPAYNVPGAAKITGELDVDRLEQAYNLVIARHDNLRTVFPSEDGVARQRILARLDFRLERIDLSGDGSPQWREEKARELCRIETSTPFDLTAGPLLRGKVITLAPQQHILLLNMHHIISDAWSLGLMIREVSQAYETLQRGRDVSLPALPVQYVDYSVWQRNWLTESGLLDRQLAYWQQKLAGAPESLDLMTDTPRAEAQGVAAATYEFVIDAQLTARLNELANQNDCSLFMVLLAAFNALLYRYTGQEDICVGSPIANRQYRETEGIIGMFANTLVMRTQVEDGDSFRRLLARVKTTCLEAYDNQDAPFEKIVDLVRPSRNPAANPLFQIMFALQNAPQATLDDRIQPYVLESGVSKFDLVLLFTEGSGGLAGWLEYRTALFGRSTVERMAAHFAALCRAVAESPDAAIGSLDYLSADETRQLLVDFNNSSAEYPRDKCIHQLIAEQAARNPDKTAVVVGDETLTYEELHERSRVLALYLQSLGAGPECRIGLFAERSLELIVGVFGIMHAGGAYVPLDPDFPDARLSHVLQDSCPPIVLTQESLAGRLRGLVVSGSRLIALDTQWAEIADRAEALRAAGVRLAPPVTAHDASYVVYTSGTTGVPKGILVTHRTMTNLISWQLKESGFGDVQRVVNFTQPSFDIFLQEMFVALLSGGTFVIPDLTTRNDPALLARFIVQHQIDTLFLPYVALTNVAGALTAYAGVPLKRVITAGEQLVVNERIRQFFTQFPAVRLYNEYGPSEAHAVTCYALPEDSSRWERLPHVGGPLHNQQVYILDRRGKPQPIGVPGEVYVAGDGLARGYLNRPELDQERFLENPFTLGARMYRTGDRARWLPDGNVQFLGRIDTQVKIRGFRVETREVEVRLNQHPQIQDVVVVLQGEGAAKRLVAFYLTDSPVDLTQEELRGHLRQTLPDYMVPAAFARLEAFPLSPTGKVDRRALERMEVRAESDRAYVAPRNATEQHLVEVWAEVLDRPADTIGINDDFFDVGGHSLLGTMIISRIRGRMGIDLPLRALFEWGTVAGLAGAIDQGDGSERQEIQWNRPFRLLKTQKGNLRAESLRSMTVPVTHLVTTDIASSRLKENVETLLEHPIFRLRIREGDQGWVQYYDGSAARVLVETVAMPEGASLADTAMALYDQHEGSINLKSGPVAKAFLLEGTRVASSDTSERYVFLMLDHFISDPVTVIVLLELLEQCCADEEERVRASIEQPLLNLQEWVAALERRAAAADVLQWKDHWLNVLRAAHAAESGIVSRLSEEPRSVQQELCIPADLIRAADGAVREERLASLETVILALFAKSCMAAFHSDAVHLTQIYNTRQDPLIGLDGGAALGWFSENYPLSLRDPNTGGVAGDVREIHRQIQEIEAKRFSYVLLSHFNDRTSKEFDGCALPGIYFNYQGRGDASTAKAASSAAYFEVYNAASALDRIVDMERYPYFLSCISRIEDDNALHVYLIYRSDTLSSGRVSEIAGAFQELWAQYAAAQSNPNRKGHND